MRISHMQALLIEGMLVDDPWLYANAIRCNLVLRDI